MPWRVTRGEYLTPVTRGAGETKVNVNDGVRRWLECDCFEANSSLWFDQPSNISPKRINMPMTHVMDPKTRCHGSREPTAKE